MSNEIEPSKKLTTQDYLNIAFEEEKKVRNAKPNTLSSKEDMYILVEGLARAVGSLATIISKNIDKGNLK